MNTTSQHDGDIRGEPVTRSDLSCEIADVKHEILIAMTCLMLAQTAVIVAVMAFLK